VTVNGRPDPPNERPRRDGVTPDLQARDERRDCPDAEQLAEYADGVLDAPAREAIEAHLVTCADCRSVLAETMAFLGEEAAADAVSKPLTLVTPAQAADVDAAPKSAAARVVPFRTRSWVTGVGATLAAAAALVLIVRIAAPGWLPPGFGGEPPLQHLVAALANETSRPVEGRLMGGFSYASPPSPLRGGTDRFGRRPSPDVQLAAAEIAKFAEGNTSVRARSALAVALIVSGDLDEAITTLEQVAKDATDSPEEAAVQTNLSAAYLARARWWNHPEDWPKALAAANRAVTLDPNALEPYFNRALAYEGLEQADLAAKAWTEYTTRDRNSDWTREADARKKALNR
jgi:hypothetical protein